MNEKIQIEHFLNGFSNLYKQNPNLEICSDTIYYNLSIYGLTEEEKNCDINYMFPRWIEKFNDAKNLRVYRDKRQYAFLQFANYYDCNPCEMIKVYMSFSEENMEKSVNLIFDFMEQNNIKSASKVAQRLRSDSVVLRLFSKEEAMQVLNFINSNEFLCRNAKLTNPFSMKVGVCGIAYDDRLSYNSCISKIIAEYFKKIRTTNQFDNVSFENFGNFVYEFYQNTFINRTQLDMLINSNEFQKYAQKHNTISQVVVNWKQITETFMTHLYSQNDINKYFELYDKFVNQYKTNELARQYENGMLVEDVFTNETKNDKVNIINEYINYAKVAYGDKQVVIQLNSFIKTDNYKLITRTNDCREKFKKYNITGLDIINLTNNNVQEYVSNFGKETNISNSQQTSNYEMECYNLFSNSCFETYKKYGKKQLIAAILHSLEGKFSYFTKREYRDALSKKINNKEQLIILCQNLLFNLGYNGTISDEKELVYLIGSEVEKYINSVLEQQAFCQK